MEQYIPVHRRQLNLILLYDDDDDDDEYYQVDQISITTHNLRGLDSIFLYFFFF